LRGGGGLEFGLSKMCLPSPGLGHEYKLKVIFEASLWHYVGRFLGENVFLYIGWSHDSSFDNLKYKTLV